jgi:hypothetical protein
LKQLKGDRKTDGHHFRSKSRLKYDTNTLQGALGKAQNYLDNQKNELELTSIDEAYLVCEAMKQIHIKEKYDLHETFSRINDKIKELENMYVRLQDFGDELEREDEHFESFADGNDIEVEGPQPDNPFQTKTPSHKDMSKEDLKVKLVNDGFSLPKLKSPNPNIERPQQNQKDVSQYSKQDELTKQRTTRSPIDKVQTPITSQRSTGSNTRIPSPLKPVVTQLKAQDLQNFFHGKTPLSELAQKDKDKPAEIDPRFKKSTDPKPRVDGARMYFNNPPVGSNEERHGAPSGNKLRIEDLRREIFKPGYK